MAITSCPPGQYTIGRDRHGNVICSGTQRNQLTNNTSRTTNNRSVNNTTPASQVELFTAPSTPRYYRPDGSIVPVGAPLHRHLDTGVTMTQHSMGPNDNSVIVTTTRPNTQTRTQRLRQRTRSNVRRRTANATTPRRRATRNITRGANQRRTTPNRRTTASRRTATSRTTRNAPTRRMGRY
jgi:hypothetical protein